MSARIAQLKTNVSKEEQMVEHMQQWIKQENDLLTQPLAFEAPPNSEVTARNAGITVNV